jgi:mannose-6-phosphate isomerase-like protein (cupin superfamily)
MTARKLGPWPWHGHWTARDPAAIDFAWAANEGGTYASESDDGFIYLDLGLADASHGALGVRRVRLADPVVATHWRALNLDFDFLYVLRGTMAVENDDGERTELATGSTALHPRGYRHRFSDFSADFEAVHVTAPAWTGEHKGESNTGLSRSASGLAPVYTHDKPDEYEHGNGPRAYFLYRDLRTREPTDGRIHLHVVRATEAGPGTGWHYHSMAQWFLIVSGSSVIRVEDRPRQPLRWGDSMCVGRGSFMRHNVTSFSHDYAVLEMCIPAQYETVAVVEPAGADHE